ncbi:MAG: hypothetical protein ABFQ95_02010 [Pseudomonadota bacterium]
MAYATLPHPYLRHHHFMQDPPIPGICGLLMCLQDGVWRGKKDLPVLFESGGLSCLFASGWGCPEAFFQSILSWNKNL